jgi:hypothetical protein
MEVSRGLVGESIDGPRLIIAQSVVILGRAVRQNSLEAFRDFSA